MSPHARKSSPPLQPILKSFEALVVGAGVTPGEFFERLRSDLALTPDPIRAVNNLHRFLSSGFTTTILRDFQNHSVLQRLALELFAQSQYLADILVRDPELFRWLTTTSALKVTKSRPTYLAEALAAVQLFERMEKRFDALKRFHRREMLRIGARDVLKEADVVIIMQELSALADAVVQCILDIGHQDLARRTGADFKNTLGVIGLGKLGGNELNFSSDIDLLFVYDQDGEFYAPQERIRTFHEYYNRLAEFIVRRLTEFTGEGHLYRVDLRLRPEGSAGSLALSRAAYMLYYETRGELWERQMLLKARPVAGNAAVAQRLLDDLQPFVFPKTFFSSPLEEIGKMKRRIEENTDAGNIKLHEGGIRDIEFITQAHQLVSGGGEEMVRISGTLEALERLRENRRVIERDQRSLSEAYRFFRVVEHRLQLLHGMQTHSIPSTRAETDLLAKRLGYETTAKLEREIDRHRKRVRKIFLSVFGGSGHQTTVRQQALHGTDSIRTRLALRKVRFIDEAGAMRNAESLTNNLPSLRDEVSWERVLHSLRRHEAPDWGLQNLALISESQSIRRTLAQAMSNPDLMDLLFLICSRSRYCSQTLSQEPLLFESLVGQPDEVFGDSWGWGLMRENDLYRYRVYNEFKILLRFFMGQLSIETATTKLSDLADHITRQTLREIPESAMAIIALGKLGGREITIGSDLDLILVYDEESIDSAEAEHAAKILLDEVASPGVYDIDFRLRPEGKNAPLATGYRYYREYLRHRSSLWERQSLTKARVAWGGEALAARISESISEAIAVSSRPAKWIAQARSMRKRMEKERSKSGAGPDLKVGKGGLVDLEFTIQILQLRFGSENRRILAQNSFDALEMLSESGAMRKADARKAAINLRFLRSLETLIRLNVENSGFVLPDEPRVLKSIAAAIGEKSIQRLKTRIKTIQSQNRVLLTGAMKVAEAR